MINETAKGDAMCVKRCAHRMVEMNVENGGSIIEEKKRLRRFLNWLCFVTNRLKSWGCYDRRSTSKQSEDQLLDRAFLKLINHASFSLFKS